jgi:hypothetical protein
MVEPVYVTREALMRALDVKPSAYMRVEVDSACRAGSRAAEGFLHRIFYPEVLTRTFDYPESGRGRGISQLWFDERSLISLNTLISDGISIPPGYALLRPDGPPPYDRLELDRDTSAVFAGGPQRAVSITGLWGYWDMESSPATLASSPGSGSTSITLAAPMEIGSILRLGQERVIVTERTWTGSGQSVTISGNKDATLLTVSDSSVFSFGEEILVEAERMEIVDIASNSLVVRRAAGGSVLAAHTGALVQRSTVHVVQRGSLGTTASAHVSGEAVYLFLVPSLVKELAQAYAEDIFLQRNSGYARTAGTGDSERMVGRNVTKGIEERASGIYRRKVRSRAV